MQQNKEDMGIYLIFAAMIGLAHIVIMVAAVLGQGCDHHCHRQHQYCHHHHLLVLGHRSFHNEGVSCQYERVISSISKVGYVKWPELMVKNNFVLYAITTHASGKLMMASASCYICCMCFSFRCCKTIY
jgi:hypothetical protein